MLRKRILTAVLGLLLPIVAFAQVNATVTGTVSDATSALIPGVEVTATNINTGIVQMSLTNETGSYNFASLQPGTYKVTAALSGFQTQAFENVLLTTGQQVRLNFTLQIAAASDTVEVTANADTALATTSSSVGQALGVTAINNLPLGVRDILSVIGATAGTAGRDFGGQGTRALNMTRDGLVINDTRYGTAAQNTSFISPDLVEEVQVVVGNVDSESGRGSGQVSLQTRSGTNQFHGAGFVFNRNSALAASDFISNQKGVKAPYINRNQFGGRLGGPIIKNKAFFFVLVDEQRYLTRDGFTATVLTPEARKGIFRYINGVQNGNATQANRSVDLAGNILNPAGLRSFCIFGDAYCNTVPGATGLTAVNDPLRQTASTNAYWAKSVLANMPMPNDYTVGDGLNTAGFRWARPIYGLGGGNTVGDANNRDQLNLRFDYQLNSNNKFTVTHTREYDCCTDASQITDWPTFGFKGTNEYFPWLATGAWTSTISSTLLNEFRFGYKQTHFERRAAFNKGCCLETDTVTAAAFNDRTAEAQVAYDLLPKSNGYIVYPIPNIAAGNILKHGFDTTRGQKSPTRQIGDTVSLTKGSHSFRLGGEVTKGWSDGWNMTSENIPTALFGDGNFGVSGITTARFPGIQSADITTATNILNDLTNSVKGLTFGRVTNSPTDTAWSDLITGDPRRHRHLTEQDWDLFVKDTWNFSKNLTLNLGLRYDKYGVLYDQWGMVARVDGGEEALYKVLQSGCVTPAACSPYLVKSILVGPNSDHPKEKFWKDDWKDFAPAVGFSYKIPWLARTTVIRGGYGINYAGALVVLDYENDFGNSPGSADVYLPATPFVPTVYTTLSTIGNISATGVTGAANTIPLPPKTQPGNIVVPLSDKTQVMNTPTNNRTTPYIQSFNLSIQRDLVAGLNLEVSYIGNKGSRLFSKYSVNDPLLDTSYNGETLLQAFNTARAGGDSPLLNKILNGLTVPGGVGLVNNTTLTGTQAFRRWTTTRTFLANGTASSFWNAVSTNSAALGGQTGVAGGLLLNAGLPAAFISPTPQFSNTQIWGTEQNSTYHSLQIQLKRQIGKGVTGQLAYTWSKALGNSPGGETGATVIDPNNHSLNKGRLSFDQTQAYTGHATWDLPFGTGNALLGGAPKWADRVVGGWQLSSIFGWVSGAPLTITGNSSICTQSCTGLPDIVGAFPKSLGTVSKGDGFVEYFPGYTAVKEPTAGLYGSDPGSLAGFNGNFNIVDPSGKTVLQNAQPGKIGTLGQRWIEGPAQLQFDMSLAKKIQLFENVAFTLRGDAISILNKPNWANPSVNINSVNFGRITGVNTANGGNRQITLSARIDF